MESHLLGYALATLVAWSSAIIHQAMVNSIAPLRLGLLAHSHLLCIPRYVLEIVPRGEGLWKVGRIYVPRLWVEHRARNDTCVTRTPRLAEHTPTEPSMKRQQRSRRVLLSFYSFFVHLRSFTNGYRVPREKQTKNIMQRLKEVNTCIGVWISLKYFTEFLGFLYLSDLSGRREYFLGCCLNNLVNWEIITAIE